MTLADVPLHVLVLIHGISAAVACFVVFTLCGMALDPRARDRIRMPGPDGLPVVLGAALYVLCCWLGIQREVPLRQVVPAYAAGVVILAALRFRRVRFELTHGAWLTREAAGNRHRVDLYWLVRRVVGDLAARCFADPFVSRWLFDLEVIIRLHQLAVVEYPLNEWTEVGGGQLRLLPSVWRTVADLWRIRARYGPMA